VCVACDAVKNISTHKQAWTITANCQLVQLLPVFLAYWSVQY
jgi:hypothetical protein